MTKADRASNEGLVNNWTVPIFNFHRRENRSKSRKWGKNEKVGDYFPIWISRFTRWKKISCRIEIVTAAEFVILLKLIVEFVRMLFMNKCSKHRFRCKLVNKFSLTSKQNYQMQFLLAGSGIDFIATERLQAFNYLVLLNPGWILFYVELLVVGPVKVGELEKVLYLLTHCSF